MPEDVTTVRCSVRKCNQEAELVEGFLPICPDHYLSVPVAIEAAPTLLDVLVTLMVSDSVEDLQAAIDMLVEIIGLVPLEGTYADGWTPADLARFGLEQDDAADL